MVDEDFVMGYAVGYNDGVGSGGSGGISVIIKDGATVYDVPIIRNYNLIGTEYGLATFDVNECAFLNPTPAHDNINYNMTYHTNPITGEVEVYKRSQPCGISRNIAYALTKGGKAIGIYKSWYESGYESYYGSYVPYSLNESWVRVEDGTLYLRKERHTFTTIRNLILTFEDIPDSYSPNATHLNVYHEWDKETRTIKYAQPKQYYNEEYLFKYYRKADLDAQTIESDVTTTVHEKVKIAVFSRTLAADNYPEEWLGKYQFPPLQYPIYGISIMDDFELTTTYFSGIA